MKKIMSFSGNSEDIILDYVLNGIDEIHYIDVGANDPLVHSVTEWFYYMGVWN